MSDIIAAVVVNVAPVLRSVPPVGLSYHSYTGEVIEPAVVNDAVIVAVSPLLTWTTAPCECALLLNSINNMTVFIIRYMYAFIYAPFLFSSFSLFVPHYYCVILIISGVAVGITVTVTALRALSAWLVPDTDT